MKPLAPLLVLCSAFGLFAGCASEPQSHVVSAPPPPAPTFTAPMVTTTSAPVTTVQTTQTTQTTPTGTTVTTQSQPIRTVVVTQTAPPAMQTEVVIARPSSAHAWIAGYWTWRNNRYEWMSGHWEIPPTTNAKWNTPRWESEAGAYRFYEGYWN